MKKIIRLGTLFYGIALIVYGVQQLVYGNFRPVFIPAWQSALPALKIWAWLFGILLIAAGIAFIAGKNTRTIALWLGGIFLALFCFVHIPFEIIADPYSKHFGLWTSALKELALSGGAFVIAGASGEHINGREKSFFTKAFEKIIPAGSVFFSITMISFGIQHFMYAEAVAALVPAWLPDHLFWTYFAAVSLIGAGVAIILDIRKKPVSILLGCMIFGWFILLHTPRAIADPSGNRGNELASAFDALAFSGIAFIIAARSSVRSFFL